MILVFLLLLFFLRASERLHKPHEWCEIHNYHNYNADLAQENQTQRCQELRSCQEAHLYTGAVPGAALLSEELICIPEA